MNKIIECLKCLFSSTKVKPLNEEELKKEAREHAECLYNSLLVSTIGVYKGSPTEKMIETIAEGYVRGYNAGHREGWNMASSIYGE